MKYIKKFFESESNDVIGNLRDIFSCVEDEYGAEVIIKRLIPKIDKNKVLGFVFSDPDFSNFTVDFNTVINFKNGVKDYKNLPNGLHNDIERYFYGRSKDTFNRISKENLETIESFLDIEMFYVFIRPHVKFNKNGIKIGKYITQFATPMVNSYGLDVIGSRFDDGRYSILIA